MSTGSQRILIPVMARDASPAGKAVPERSRPEEGRPVRINLGCGTSALPDFINVDVAPYPGVDLLVNLFEFPWAALSKYENQADSILCSHLVEHIPHDVKATGGYPLRDQDGFFCFFYECWRLLRPGGEMEVVVPHARSRGAYQDPTHRRYLVETSFSYLNPEKYRLGPPMAFAFDCSRIDLKVNQKWASVAATDAPRANEAASNYWDVIEEMKAVLTALK